MQMRTLFQHKMKNLKEAKVFSKSERAQTSLLRFLKYASKYPLKIVGYISVFPASRFKLLIMQRKIFQEDHLPQCCKAVLNSIQLLSSFLCFSNFTGYDVFIGVQGSMANGISKLCNFSLPVFYTTYTFCQSNCTKLLQQLILKRRSRGTFKWTPSWDFVFKNRKVPMGEGGKLACPGSASASLLAPAPPTHPKRMNYISLLVL